MLRKGALTSHPTKKALGAGTVGIASRQETLQEGFDPASLQLETIKTHVGTALLNNAAVVRWLAKRRPDHLQQLQKLSEIRQLPS